MKETIINYPSKSILKLEIITKKEKKTTHTKSTMITTKFQS
jgi:hypothetical protein